MVLFHAIPPPASGRHCHAYDSAPVRDTDRVQDTRCDGFTLEGHLRPRLTHRVWHSCAGPEAGWGPPARAPRQNVLGDTSQVHPPRACALRRENRVSLGILTTCAVIWRGTCGGLLMSYALRLFPLAEALVDAPVRALTLRTAIESLREKSEYVFTATAAAAQRPRDEIRARPWIPEPISGFANKTSKAPTG